ncbi:MAG: glucose-6-phosphate isomerase [Burkholderiales bacterium]|jgi:glucose-6-phosphate isomerase
MPRLFNSSTWKNLEECARDPDLGTITELFNQDPSRAEKFSLELGGLYLDYSRNQINEKTRDLLLTVCDHTHLRDQITAMFLGKRINTSENRAVLHTALRSSGKTTPEGPPDEIRASTHKNLEQMRILSNKFRDGLLIGATGQNIDAVINIGIGGSDLGPKLVYSALRSDGDPRVLFVSNIDESDLTEKLNNVNPAKTLFIIASKTFTTAETITNAKKALSWLTQTLNVDEKIVIEHHFVATTANASAAEKFGIRKKNIYEFRDWVGGRYSLWSAVGLPIAIGLGFEEFEALLKGAEEMDLHFNSTPAALNLPIMLALVGIWHINFRNHSAQAILPYTERLSLFPEYLQQLEMESNGKMVDRSESAIDYTTAPIIWGSRGTNFQHSFAQHLHQSPIVTPCDFIGVVKNSKNQQSVKPLLANCLAQIEALAFGNRGQETLSKKTKPSRIIEGNRPSNVIILDELNAKTLGSLLALYEHKVFVQGVIWNINSFDQWGVELGKSLAKTIEEKLDSNDNAHGKINSSANLIERINTLKQRSN